VLLHTGSTCECLIKICYSLRMKTFLLKSILLLSLISNALLLYLVVEQKNVQNAVEHEELAQQAEQPVMRLPESGNTYPLIRIIDGDTIVVGFDKQTQYVRLIGIDSPEPNDPGGPECYADEATKHLQALAQTGLVVLHFDESQGTRDTYGRLLAYIELPDGTDLGKKMIEDGYAREYTYNTAYTRQADYQAAENDAMENERGLWAPGACDE